MTPNPSMKRYMPVMPKQGVFNEWGAVLKHQDEMEIEQERQEYALNKVSFAISFQFRSDKKNTENRLRTKSNTNKISTWEW